MYFYRPGRVGRSKSVIASVFVIFMIVLQFIYSIKTVLHNESNLRLFILQFRLLSPKSPIVIGINARRNVLRI